MSNGDFYAMLLRMKNIDRWCLMFNTRAENLSEHSLECAILAHALAVIGITKFGRDYNAEKIATAAMFHDMSEIFTGDLPTPVKYYNDDIKTSYKSIEKIAEDKLLAKLDDDTRAYYSRLLAVNDRERMIIKAADKLCAYIKCEEELKRGNGEFGSAKEAAAKAIDTMDCPELQYFMANYLSSFSKTLDEVSL